ncbi:MAG: glycosyltransferase, partial [Croceibacterium sp.]
KGGVRVWGEVAAVQPFLAAADVVVAPLTIARGIQNKVLEAMAMARPVLLTPDAATGIAATNGVHFAVVESDADLLAGTLALLADERGAAAMGAAARRFVIETMSWPAMLAPLPQLVGREARQPGRRDAA